MSALDIRLSNVRSTAQVGQSERGRASQATQAPAAPLPPPSANAAGAAETIRTLSGVGSAIDAALASGDPDVMMAAIGSRINRDALESSRTDASIQQTRRHAETQQQLDAYKRAQEAEQSGALWSTIAKIGTYVGAALSVAVGVCGAAFTGGTSLLGGIALCAVCISAAATTTLEIAQDVHAIPTPPPEGFSIGVGIISLVGSVVSWPSAATSALSLVGSSLSIASQVANLGSEVLMDAHAIPDPPPWVHFLIAGVGMAGAAASAGASMASSEGVSDAISQAAGVVRTVGQIGLGVARIAQGIGAVGTAVTTHDADEARVDALSHQAAAQRASMRFEDVVSEMQEILGRGRREVEHASESMGNRGRAQLAMIGNLGRA